MTIIYIILLRIYFLLIYSASLFNKKAQKWIIGRKNWQELISNNVNPAEKWIWFHCSSLGEYEDSQVIFSQIKKDNPSSKIALSFFSPSGFEVLNTSQEYDLIMYLPLDTRNNARKFLDILKPKIVFFSRSELWFNFIMEIKKRNIPIFLLSLKLNNKSSFLKWPSRILFERCFKTFTHLFCQDELTSKLLNNYFQIKSTSITGNTRFDRIYQESLSEIKIPYIEQFVKNNFVVIAGSVLQKDEEILIKTIKKIDNLNIKYIIVPHEIESEKIDSFIKFNTDKAIRYSNIRKIKETHNILYFDIVGSLKYLYKYSNFAIIGGGFDKIGIHNIIEPSVFGVKTTFGPNYKNYKEAIDLIKIGAATIYHNSNELLNIINNEITNQRDDNIKNEIVNYVKNNTGGSIKILESLKTQYSDLF